MLDSETDLSDPKYIVLYFGVGTMTVVKHVSFSEHQVFVGCKRDNIVSKEICQG